MSTRRQFICTALMSLLGGRFALASGSAGFGRGASGLLFAPEMIGRVTGASAQVNLVSGRRAKHVIRWGRSLRNLNRKITMEGKGSLNATLSGLRAGGDYYYRVSSKALSDPAFHHGGVHRFVTQRPPGSAFKFAVLADGHILGGPNLISWYERAALTVERLASEDIDFVVFVGDEACVDGSGAKGPSPLMANDQEQTQARYALLRNLYAPLLASRPAFLVLGNHDGEAAFSASKRVRDFGTVFRQRWCTIARKRYFLNPRHDTYTEGGENEGWRGDDHDPAYGGAAEGNASPLENYYAWGWGDALFVVLDAFRYLEPALPGTPEDWTLGQAQLRWLKRTLASSRHRHKFVIAHHLLGGAPYDSDCNLPGAYGRGGAEYAHVGEQRIIQRLMRRYGAGFFLYGHDHVFSHSTKGGVNYVCCGRSGALSSRWFDATGWREIYGDNFASLIGYLLVEVDPERVRVSYKISGNTYWQNQRWGGRRYPLAGDLSVEVESEPLEVIRIWSPDDSSKTDLFPGGNFSGRKIWLGRAPADGGKFVNVVYVGQEAFGMEFGK